MGGITLCFAAPVQAQVWNEQGDAGSLPNNAQITVGFGPLRDIRGNAPAANNVDLYAIRIMNPQDFSATTLPPPGAPPPPPGTLRNPVLYLFDSTGRGVYANDNVEPQNPESLLPAHHPLGPTSPGLYFLGIAPFDNRPLGRNSLIFGNIGGPGIFGADRTNPVDAWRSTPLNDQGNYRIHLTGAGFAAMPVPEPGSITFVVGLGVISLFGLRRRMRR
mgnify:CR=1 FL=1